MNDANNKGKENLLELESVTDQLFNLGVDVFKPHDDRMAEAMEAFSHFVLEEEKDLCQQILIRHLGRSVGELQGGSSDFEIYRVMISEDDSGEDGEATDELLGAFYNAHFRYRHVMTKHKLQQYMLQMCQRRVDLRGGNQTYEKLGNLMLILTFGKTQGQVRHIDHMDPNLQICLYMSRDCPSTVVFALEEPPITNTIELIHSWELYHSDPVPVVLKDILLQMGSLPLVEKFYAKDFASWTTINHSLETFGKLYQKVSASFSMDMEPGVTLVAAGNQVHAGPPTLHPRMFAFAIGIASNKGNEDGFEEDNDGEAQYSPSLFHIDVCRILFGALDYDYASSELNSGETNLMCKAYLLNILVSLIRTYPEEPFDRLISDEFEDLRAWLLDIVGTLGNGGTISSLVAKAIESESMFYSSKIRQKRAKRRKRGRRKA